MKIKPCPFCGSTSTKVMGKTRRIGRTGIDEPVEHFTASVRCNKCNARGTTASGRVVRTIRQKDEQPSWAKEEWEIRDKAIEAWNRREPTDKIVEQLEEIFDKWGLDNGKKEIMREIVKKGGAE